MKKVFSENLSRALPRILTIGVLVCIVLFLYRGTLIEAGERAMLFIDPSAERAMRYGDGHFDATSPVMYDLRAADYFYAQARELDESHPFLNHQLGRLAFLRGNFNTAVYFIDREIAIQGTSSPTSFYMRGLIQGYMGEYDKAAADYEVFLSAHPDNWAAVNDYAWVLLKAKRHEEAAAVTSKTLVHFPDNAWLLNTNAIALFETGEYARALESAKKAVDMSKTVTTAQWLSAYPGNDPKIAGEGIKTLRDSALETMHIIESKVAAERVQ